MTTLLDGNVLVALAVDEQFHHDVAAAWFERGSGAFAKLATFDQGLAITHADVAELLAG